MGYRGAKAVHFDDVTILSRRKDEDVRRETVTIAEAQFWNSAASESSEQMKNLDNQQFPCNDDTSSPIYAQSDLSSSKIKPTISDNKIRLASSSSSSSSSSNNNSSNGRTNHHSTSLGNSLNKIYLNFLCAVLCLSWFVQNCDSQFISYFNSRGLRGNITFDIKTKNGATTELIIEAFIQADELAGSIFGGVDETTAAADAVEPLEPTEVKFEWRLHPNTISTQALLFCSGDELGSQISEKFTKSLSEGRPIVLNKVNQWIVPMVDTKEQLSSLIWGKSVSLRLSDEYKPQARPAESSPAEASASPAASNSQPSNTTLVRPNQPRISPIAIPNAANKPTFAPRPRPSSSAPRLRVLSVGQAAGLPKAQSLVLDATDGNRSSILSNLSEPRPIHGTPTPTPTPTTTTTTTTTTAGPKQKNSSPLLMRNEQIVKMFGRILVCGNIIDTRNVKTAEAVFESQVAGRVTIRGNEDGTTLLMANLYHIKSKITSRHDWKILATDILDDRRHEDQCKYLQVLFDPDNVGSDNNNACRKSSDHRKCPIGELTKKHGQIQVAGLTKTAKTTFVDLNLPVNSFEGSRSLFLVLYEATSTTTTTSGSRGSNIMGCAQIKPVSGRKVEANFNMDGVRGSIRISQRHLLEPATVSLNLFGLESNTKYQSIRELPMPARTSSDNSKLCSSLGTIYDPYKNQRLSLSAWTNRKTADMFEVGNLSSKLLDGLAVVDSEYEDHYMAEYVDLSLQLFGPTTVAGRSILIHKNNGDPWVCSNLNYVEETIRLAAATFYYPVVGRIYFQQLANDASSETGVLVEVYNPNSEKDSDNHNWALHLRPSMADFYNWSQRCESAGEIYDPLAIVAANQSSAADQQYSRQCQPNGLANEPLRCRSGDLTLKSGMKISLPSGPSRRARLYYTDLYLPLAQANSIVGRSVVIYDENSPKQRGNRLACSTIKLIHPMMASVRSWNSGPTIPSALTGYMEFEQSTPNAATKLKIDLGGFNGNVENYAIHRVWTQDDREFPCSNDSLYDIFDPYDSENSLRLPPAAHYGSLATADRVRVGDLSKKHGNFEGLQSYHKTLVDSNAPLFAPHSIVGRSVVLRAAVNDFRWICGNIELDYDKSFSRQIIGIASFDEPRSKIAGFVRFIQLEHKDGSLSDTLVQVDLKMQTSETSRELEPSKDHNWAIFVNQVGEDAFIAADEVRCIAAGFKWNPYLAQDNLESYPIACSSREQLTCAMGDLGMKHELLTLGPNDRRTYSDSNLPLVGNYSVMGRSLVIFDNKRPNVKLACANIMPDIHLKSNVVIKRTPSFTVARFVEQMRSLLGAAEWLLVPELKATKPVASGECVQMTIHFYGQKAHQMQIELNNLITLGTVRKSTRAGTDKISTHYKLCRAGQAQLTSSAPSLATKTPYFELSVAIIICILTLLSSPQHINSL